MLQFAVKTEGTVLLEELTTNGRAIHQRNGYSARNYPLIDEESTKGMGYSARVLPTNGQGIHQRNGYSTRNYPLLDEESTRGMVIPPGITH
jgi:hypothetical protein